jgi:type I restriction enzyme, R subunit
MILSAYKENWEEIVNQLSVLREEMKVERKKEEPFYDLIATFLESTDNSESERIRVLTENILSIIKDSARIRNFWSKASERRKMEGMLDEELIFSDIPGIMEKAGELTTELMKLAKNREADLR